MNNNPERERALAALLDEYFSYSSHLLQSQRGIATAVAARAYDAGHARAEQLERDKQALVDQAKHYKDKAEQLERELAVERDWRRESDVVKEELRKQRNALERELAAERGRTVQAQNAHAAAVRDRKFAESALAAERAERTRLEHAHCIEGDYTGEKPPLELVIERLQAAAVRFRDEREAGRAELQRCRELIERIAVECESCSAYENAELVRVYRGMAKHLRAALSVAPPAEVPGHEEGDNLGHPGAGAGA